MGQARAGLDAADRRARSQAACARLLNLPEMADLTGRMVAGYVALAERGELDPEPALAAIAARGGRVAYPRVAAPASPLAFHLADRAELVSGRFGLSEPAPHAPELAAAALDAVLVPGVAFDAAGRRLGLGGGFYDRTFGSPALSGSQTRRPPLIGLCYDLQVVAQCPSGPDDVAVDVVVTESRVLRREPAR